MIKLISKLLMSLLPLTFIACGGGGGSDNSSTDNTEQNTSVTEEPLTKFIYYPKYYDLDNADALVISDKANTLQAPSRLANGYANIGDITTIIQKYQSRNTDSGEVDIVDVNITYEAVEVAIDEFVEEPEVFPYDSFNINDRYILTRYNDGEVDEIWGTRTYPKTSYLVRKSDGFISHDIGEVAENRFDKIVQSDSSDNFYAMVSKEDMTIWNYLAKITLDNDGNFTKISNTYANDAVLDFVVDSQGNVAYFGNDGSGYGAPLVARYIKQNGDAYNLPQFDVASAYLLMDYNDNIIYSCLNTGAYYTKIMDATTLTINDYGSTAVDGIIDYIKRVKNKGVIMAKMDYGLHEIAEVVNPAQEVKNIDATAKFDLAIFIGLDSSNNNYYIHGTDQTTKKQVLRKVDPSNDTIYTTILSGDYNITSMSVTDDDIVNFIGIRLNDSANVAGQISSTGTLSIIKTLQDGEEILSLEAISN